jgi:hypothetical protein
LAIDSFEDASQMYQYCVDQEVVDEEFENLCTREMLISKLAR